MSPAGDRIRGRALRAGTGPTRYPPDCAWSPCTPCVPRAGPTHAGHRRTRSPLPCSPVPAPFKPAALTRSRLRCACGGRLRARSPRTLAEASARAGARDPAASRAPRAAPARAASLHPRAQGRRCLCSAPLHPPPPPPVARGEGGDTDPGGGKGGGEARRTPQPTRRGRRAVQSARGVRASLGAQAGVGAAAGRERVPVLRARPKRLTRPTSGPGRTFPPWAQCPGTRGTEPEFSRVGSAFPRVPGFGVGTLPRPPLSPREGAERACWRGARRAVDGV